MKYVFAVTKTIIVYYTRERKKEERIFQLDFI